MEYIVLWMLMRWICGYQKPDSEHIFRQFVIKNSILNELKLLKKRNQTSIVKKDLKIS